MTSAQPLQCAPFWIFGQKTLDQSFASFASVIIVLGRKKQLFLHDGRNDVIFLQVIAKGKLPTHHLVEQDTQGPEIRFQAVTCITEDLFFAMFFSPCPRRGRSCCHLTFFCSAEVDVFWLEVSINHTSHVQGFQNEHRSPKSSTLASSRCRTARGAS